MPETIHRFLMPLSFEGLKKQRFRWCFGGVQLLRKHWEALTPWAHLVEPENRLTFAQRYFYLADGLQWFTDAFNLLFALLLVLVGFLNLLSVEFTVRPLTGPLMILPAIFLVLNLWRFVWVLRHTSRLSWPLALRAMYGLFSVGWVVALACFQGVIRAEGVFLRTPKIKGNLQALNALRITQWETGLDLLCLVTALATLIANPNSNTLFLAALLIWKSSLYLSATAYSLLSVKEALAWPFVRDRSVVPSSEF